MDPVSLKLADILAGYLVSRSFDQLIAALQRSVLETIEEALDQDALKDIATAFRMIAESLHLQDHWNLIAQLANASEILHRAADRSARKNDRLISWMCSTIGLGVTNIIRDELHLGIANLESVVTAAERHRAEVAQAINRAAHDRIRYRSNEDRGSDDARGLVGLTQRLKDQYKLRKAMVQLSLTGRYGDGGSEWGGVNFPETLLHVALLRTWLEASDPRPRRTPQRSELKALAAELMAIDSYWWVDTWNSFALLETVARSLLASAKKLSTR